MTDQIALWKTEHSNFLRLLDLLDAEIRVFHAGGRPDYDLMLDIVYYLIHYPDRFHHPKEDVAIERLLHKDPACRAVAADLKREHRVIADSGGLLLEHLQAVVGGVMMARAAVEAPAATYAAYYRQHMAREEKELFPRVRRHFKAGDWTAVEKAVPSQKDPLFGDHAEERYVDLHRRIVEAAEPAKA